jgi:SAM-dependent methyltransferase
MEPKEKLISALNSVIEETTLKKLVFSRPTDKKILRTEGKLINIKENTALQLETFTSDGKAFHKNIPISEAVDAILSMLDEYRQLNLITTCGDLEAKTSSKGKLFVSGKLGKGSAVNVSSHDHEKNNILKEGNIYPFLVRLGVTDESGRVFDKKRAKFRQIDRFLHYIYEIYPRLSSDNELYVLDLCCGKSYLTFAAYWYLTEIKGRTVKMVGADLKEDVIDYCSSVSRSLGYEGLTFICCDILKFIPERRPDLVLSLHACDIATDIVLTTAAKLGAEVILSTPCCQHQINSQLNTSTDTGRLFSPVLQHSLIKQKLAVAITDALRCKRLEASGYAVDVTELIDPENTPKNLMIRAHRTNLSKKAVQKHLDEYNALCSALGIELFGDSPSAPDQPYILYKEENSNDN